jgi:beta-lactamase class A
MKVMWLCHLILFLALTGCVGRTAERNVVKNNNAAEKPADSGGLKLSDPSTSALRNQIEQIANAAQGRVGVAATLLETGESVALNADQQFPMQSVYKLPIAMAVLDRVDRGEFKLEQKIRVEKSDLVGEGQRSPIRDRHPDGAELSINDLLRFMVSDSDGTACDVLLKNIAQPDSVMSYLHALGVNGVIVANTEKEFGADNSLQYRNWATPESMLILLCALQESRTLSQPSRALLMKLLMESPTGPKRLKGLLPAGASVAHKTGTSGTVNDLTAATNDVGLITLPNRRHLAIAVFVSDSKADVATREGVIAKIARAAWDYWNK